jgi:membrane associated rhomboid family serine protease
MPRCVDCGTETPRDEMLGPPDELRCRKCVNKRYPVYDERPVRHKPLPPYLTYGIVITAGIGTVVHLTRPALVGWAIEAPVFIWEGQFWRLVTTVFIHGDPIHLLFDVYWMWVFGRDVENWLGPIRFAGLFLLLAFGSSAGQTLAGSSGIGLSGVVYGLFGLLYALRLHREFAARLMQPSTVQVFVFWFFLCIVLTYMNVWHVANIAHGAGAVFGWLLGRAVLARQRSAVLLGVCALAIAEMAATQYMPWNADYDIFRGYRSIERLDYSGALYWFRKAEHARPNDEQIRAYVRDLEQGIKSANQ